MNTTEIKEEYIGSDRFYEFGDYKYPSITTVLGKNPETLKGLEFWKAHLINQGMDEEEAQKAMQQKREDTASRGTALHSMVERYLLDGREVAVVDDEASAMFAMLQPELDRIELLKIGDTLMTEEIVYSHKLGVAGRLDYCGYFDNTLSIIDLKTTTKLKPKRQRDAWFKQACFYSLALLEMYDILAEQIVIINPGEDMKLRIYKEEIYDWTTALKADIDYYKEEYQF